MPYQSIFSGQSPPAANPRTHLFDSDFTPGKYAQVNAGIAAQQPAAPPPAKAMAPPSGPTGFWQRLQSVGWGLGAKMYAPVAKQNARADEVDAANQKLYTDLIQSGKAKYGVLSKGMVPVSNRPSEVAQQTATTTAQTQGNNPLSLAKRVGTDLVNPFVDVAKAANKNVVPLFAHPTAPPGHNINDIMQAQGQAQAAIKAGHITPEVMKAVGQIQSPSDRLIAYRTIADTSLKPSDMVAKLNPIIQKQSANTKRMIGDALQIASLAVAGGETVDLAKGGKAAVVPLLKSGAVNATAGAAGNVGAELVKNPNATGKQLFKAGATGGGLGLGLTVGGAVAGKILSDTKGLFGHDAATTDLIANSKTKALLDKGAEAPEAASRHIPVVDANEPKLLTAGNKAPVRGEGFVMQTPEQSATATLVNKRLAQLDKTIKTAQLKGTTASADTMRSVMQERQAFLDVAAGKKTLADITEVLPPETHQGLTAAMAKDRAMATSVSNTPTASISAPVPRGSKITDTKTPAAPEAIDKTFDNIKVAHSQGNVSGALHEIHSLFNPVPGNPQGDLAKTTLRANLGKFNAARGQEAIAAKSDQDLFSKMSSADHLKFIYRVQTGQEQPTAALKAVAEKYKTINDENYKLGQSLKPDLPYIKDYFTQSGILDPRAGEEFYNKWVKSTLGGKPGALEQRSFPTVKEMIDYAQKNNIPIRETNPATLALNSRVQLLKAKMAQDFLAEAEQKGVDKTVAQKYIDRHLEQGFGPSKTFQNIKQAAYALNNLQLGLSGFHFTGTTLNSIFSRFANGLKDVETLHPVAGATNIVTSPAAPVIDSLYGHGMISEAKAGIENGKYAKYIKYAQDANFNLLRNDYSTKGLRDSLADLTSGNVKQTLKGVVTLPARVLSTTARPLMEHWVPALKAGAFKASVDAELRSLPKNATQDEIRAAVQKVADSIDNRMGQLNRDNLMWSKWLKDSSSILMRSPGWNIGTVREVGGGAANLLKPSTYKNLVAGRGLPQSTNYTIALAGGTMLIGAVLQHLFTGKGPTDIKDYFYPKTGQTDKNGNEERVSLPTYAKDVFAFIHSPSQTISNKANPLLSTAAQLKSNKDYFGNDIRNPSDSAVTQAKQVGSYILKNARPFSVSNSNQRADQSTGTKVQSFFGVTPAPGYITKSAMAQDIQSRFNKMMGNRTLTPEEVAANQEKSQARTGSTPTDTKAIDRLVQQGKITPKQAESLKADVGKSLIQRQFDRLSSDEKLQIIEKYSPEQLKVLDLSGLAKALVDSSSRNTVESLQGKGYSPDRIKRDLQKAGIDSGQLDQIRTSAKQAAAAKARANRSQPKWTNPIR